LRRRFREVAFDRDSRKASSWGPFCK